LGKGDENETDLQAGEIYSAENPTQIWTCLAKGFEWPWRGSLITRREGEEIVGVCYKVEVGTHKDRK
jgi:hypothetical protein